MPIALWRAVRIEDVGGFWYCVREGFRVPDTFLCRNEEQARAAADALNLIASDRYITTALTEATNMLYVPRSDGT